MACKETHSKNDMCHYKMASVTAGTIDRTALFKQQQKLTLIQHLFVVYLFCLKNAWRMHQSGTVPLVCLFDMKFEFNSYWNSESKFHNDLYSDQKQGHTLRQSRQCTQTMVRISPKASLDHQVTWSKLGSQPIMSLSGDRLLGNDHCSSDAMIHWQHLQALSIRNNLLLP